MRDLFSAKRVPDGFNLSDKKKKGVCVLSGTVLSKLEVLLVLVSDNRKPLKRIGWHADPVSHR